MKSLSVSSRSQPTFRFTIAALAGFTFIALFLRSHFLNPQVFTTEFIRFQENDPWYHVRAIEYLVAHFPHRLTWDPYALHPGGEYIAIGPLIDYWIASISLIVGAGHPSTRLIETVCAWFPAVLGALTTIPAYFLGRILRDSRTGLIAAATIAVLPGPFFKRSCLGYTDHHVAETFFSACSVIFLLLMIRRTSSCVSLQDRKLDQPTQTSRRPLFLAVLLGLSLGLYLATWVGGSLFVLTIFVALMTQLIVEHLRGGSVCRSLLWLTLAWSIALLPIIPFRDTPGFQYHIVALVGSVLFMLAAAAMSRYFEMHRVRRKLFPIGLFALTLGGLAILWLARPNLATEITDSVSRFLSGKAGTFVREARPLLYEEGIFTLRPAFEMFQLTGIAAGLGAGILFLRIRKSAAPGGVMILSWSLAVALATLVQERFAYYLAINIALLSAYFWGFLLETLGSVRWRPPYHRFARVIGYGLVVLVGLLPSAAEAYKIAHKHTGPSRDWYQTMTWLREHSPEPFAASDFFYRLYDSTVGTASMSGPKADYSVMCVWDYGYWVTQIAHRVPIGNPTQSGVHAAAEFYASQNEESAAQIMKRLDARYVIVNDELPVWYSEKTRDIEGTFGTIATFAGYDDFSLYEPMLVPQPDGTYERIVVYYPEYYQSMLTRLYLFGGKGYLPDSTTWAIRVSSISQRSIQATVIDEGRQFASYEKAAAFLQQHAKESWRIVGLSPFESCVPLEPIRQFRRVYQSATRASMPNPKPMSEVEIFEFHSVD